MLQRKLFHFDGSTRVREFLFDRFGFFLCSCLGCFADGRFQRLFTALLRHRPELFLLESLAINLAAIRGLDQTAFRLRSGFELSGSGVRSTFSTIEISP